MCQVLKFDTDLHLSCISRLSCSIRLFNYIATYSGINLHSRGKRRNKLYLLYLFRYLPLFTCFSCANNIINQHKNKVYLLFMHWIEIKKRFVSNQFDSALNKIRRDVYPRLSISLSFCLEINTPA
jgi:hypothetical protein